MASPGVRARLFCLWGVSVESRNELLCRLRELLYAEPSPGAWRELLSVLSGVRGEGEDLSGVVLPYVLSHLSRWPDGLKVLPPSEFVRGVSSWSGRPWWWSVARRLEVTVVVDHLVEVRRDDWAVGSPLEGVLEDGRGLLCGMKWLDLSHLRVPDSRTTMAPWAEVSMHGPDDVVKMLSVSGALRGLEGLSLRSVRTRGGEESVGVEGVRSLVGAGGLGGLSWLDVGDNAIGPQGNIMLLSGQWPGLRQLRVDGCGLTGWSLGGLGESSFTGSLEVLDVSENDLGVEGVEGMECGLGGGLGGLRELCVCGVGLPAEGLGRLVSAGGGRLRKLVAYECEMGELGYESLRRARGVECLESLSLSGTGWSSRQWLGLLSGVEFEGLRHLSVSQEDVGEMGVWLGESGLSRLEGLSVLGMECLEGGLEAWSSRRDLSLQEVDISHSHLSVWGCGVLSCASWLCGLRELSLDGNEIGDEGLCLLLSGGLLCLVELSLVGCGLSDESMSMLVSSGVLSGLRALHLGGNEIGVDGLKTLLCSGQCGELRLLDVSDNPLEEEGGLEWLSGQVRRNGEDGSSGVTGGGLGNVVELHVRLGSVSDGVRVDLLDILR